MMNESYIIEHLQKALDQSRMHPVLMFAGKSSESLIEFCKKFFNSVLKMEIEHSSSDLLWIDGSKERIKLAEANRVLDHLSVQSNGKHRVVLIHLVEQMTTEAANHLLKTLEEPPENVVFVLTTLQPRYVIATIRSRAFLVRIPRPLQELAKHGSLSLVEDRLTAGIEAKFAEIARLAKSSPLKETLDDFEIEWSKFSKNMLSSNSNQEHLDPIQIQRRRDLLSRLRQMISKKKIALNPQLSLESVVAVQHSRNESTKL